MTPNRSDIVAETLKDKAIDAGQAVADAAKSAGKNIAERAESAVEWVREKAGVGNEPQGISEHMDVIASCGTKIGVVDRLEGGTIKLTKNDDPDQIHHYIPTSWVARVDKHVHLTKNSSEARTGWKSDAASCVTAG
jgi:hypothetical protein